MGAGGPKEHTWWKWLQKRIREVVMPTRSDADRIVLVKGSMHISLANQRFSLRVPIKWNRIQAICLDTQITFCCAERDRMPELQMDQMPPNIMVLPILGDSIEMVGTATDTDFVKYQLFCSFVSLFEVISQFNIWKWSTHTVSSIMNVHTNNCV